MGGINLNSGLLSLDTTVPFDYDPDQREIDRCKNLTELADLFGSDKGSIKHNYTEVYESYLRPLKHQEVSLCEIGVACGASLKMWSHYFEKGKIVGYDIREECASLASSYENIEIKISNPALTRIDYRFDIIIDDGSHISKDIRDTFLLNFCCLKSGGWYFIEDTICTFNPNYRNLVGFERESDHFRRAYFLELVDRLLRDLDSNPNTQISQIMFHRQLVGIRKK